MSHPAPLPVPTDVKNALSEYPELLQKLLFHRNIVDSETAADFLNPDYEQHVHDPYLLSDMDKAVVRIMEAIENNEHIAIYADYDADGIPGAVVLHDFFVKIGYENFEVYIPHRHEEGYGFHKEAVDALAKNDTKLIITVDVGISDVDSVAYAQEQDIDVIVTDHHEPGEQLPEAYAIVNPKLGEYPDRMLCGAAVAWKVVVALIREIQSPSTHAGSLSATFASKVSEGWSKWLLDMVGIATISDMVPLVGENRVLAHFGLKVLRKSPRPGLQLLLRKIKVAQKTLTEDDIAFMITPRINAASRMSHPIEAFKVLSLPDEVLAREAVDHLIEMNDQRKTLVATTMKKAKATLQKREVREVVVIGHPDWQAGILGLVATKLVETYERPAFVWSREGDVIKGSCRGWGNTSVLEIMAGATDRLIQFGGHAGAGGFSVTTEEVHFLEESLVASYNALSDVATNDADDLCLDDVLTLDEVTMANYKLIEQCAPFGVANPKPLFLFKDVIISSVKVFGKTKNHLELTLKSPQGKTVKAIQFFKTPDEYDVSVVHGAVIQLLAYFDYSTFRGRGELRLRILDIF